jgi:hypothetical protein
VERPDRDKHSSLMRSFVNFGPKKISDFGLRSKFCDRNGNTNGDVSASTDPLYDLIARLLLCVFARPVRGVYTSDILAQKRMRLYCSTTRLLFMRSCLGRMRFCTKTLVCKRTFKEARKLGGLTPVSVVKHSIHFYRTMVCRTIEL